MKPAALTRLVSVLTVSLVTGAAAAPTWASTASEERQGAALVRAVNEGQRSCGSLSATELDRVGEYAMGLGFTSSAAHEAMNQRMTTMMGPRGEQQAHQAMGRSYSGCAAAGGETGSGMMGSWNPPDTQMMGGYGAGMMSSSAYGPGTTRASAIAQGDGLGIGSVVVVALAAAMLGAGLFAFVMSRLHRSWPTADSA